MKLTFKQAVLFTALFAGLNNIAAAQNAQGVQVNITGEITNKTCQFQNPTDNVIQMVAKEASEFTGVTDVDGVTSKDLAFSCAPDLPIKVTVTDRAQAATNRNYLSNLTGTCNGKTCATGVGVKVRFFDSNNARVGGTTDVNLGQAITLRAAPSNPNYAQAVSNVTYKVRGFYTKTGNTNPTPGGVEAQALFTFSYQ